MLGVSTWQKFGSTKSSLVKKKGKIDLLLSRLEWYGWSARGRSKVEMLMHRRIHEIFSVTLSISIDLSHDSHEGFIGYT